MRPLECSGPLAFVAVRQKHGDAGEQRPLVFAGGDKLVDDNLCAVGEVAKLRFPQNESFGIVAAKTVFETEHGGFGKRGVVGFEPGLIRGEVFERNVFFLVLDVDERGVTLIESAAAAVLSGEADGSALLEQRAERESFGHAVIERALALRHFEALFEKFFNFRMNVEAVGIGDEARADIQ